MKKLFFYFIAGAVIISMLSSCAASKRDCNGVKHTRLKNGIYL
jgi:hypothetical protein